MADPLILVPGLLSNKVLWHHQSKNLKSYFPIQVPTPIQNNADAMVEAILANAPPKFALAGHSMGGWLCLEVMRKEPKRVTKLCLLNTTARDDAKEKKEKREELISRAKEKEFPQIVKEISTRFVLNSVLIPDIEKMFLEVGEEAFINQEEAMLNRDSCLNILPKIACPTLIIHSAQDQNFSLDDQVELQRDIPNAKLAVIEDCGHMSPMEMPQAITALLHFWLTEV